MKKIYHLGTCDKCREIINRLGGLSEFDMHDIKNKPIPEDELDHLKNLVGSYEALFSKRAQLYRDMKLKHDDLKEPDYRKYILKEYTFLKRPVILVDDQIFVGNEKYTVEAAIRIIMPLTEEL
ncbi:MAG: ArsC/Spx/MgsR family protein [Saprospiraceae bacterium]